MYKYANMIGTAAEHFYQHQAVCTLTHQQKVMQAQTMQSKCASSTNNVTTRGVMNQDGLPGQN